MGRTKEEPKVADKPLRFKEFVEVEESPNEALNMTQQETFSQSGTNCTPKENDQRRAQG